MKYFLSVVLFIHFLFSSLASERGNNFFLNQSRLKSAASESSFSSDLFYFIENKGQLKDDHGAPASDVQFYCRLPGVNVFFLKDRIVYDFFKMPDAKSSEEVIHYRLDMVFSGTNENIKVTGKKNTGGSNNYFTGGKTLEQYSGVLLYAEVLYSDIYPGIDLLFYNRSDGKGIKYDFIVRPGGRPDDIRYQYDGASRTAIKKNGDLHIKTPLGNITEASPFSYQIIGQDTGIVQSFFSKNQDFISFKTGNYQKNQNLIIDPSVLVWSTYYGGNGTSEQSTHMTTDKNGDLIVCGNTNSTVFPTTVGSIQSVSGGGNEDGFILKFSPSGARIWATYLGGSRGDDVRSCETDASGNIFLTGTTMSLNFPLLNPGGGAFFRNTNPASTAVPTNPTAFISKISPGGTLSWSTYFGGSVGESGIDAWLDSGNNLYVTGCSASMNFPVTAGAFQTTMAGPVSLSGVFGDAFLGKFSNSGVQLWTTFIGGSFDDISYGIATDASDNVYIAGWTLSTNFPVSPGAYQSLNGGPGDAFVAAFSSAGNRLWSTYYGGPGGQRALDCVISNGFLYISGISAGTIPGPTGSVFQPNNAGGVADGFVAKMSLQPGPNQVIWRTFGGGSGDDGFDEITKNNSGNIVLGGWTNSPNFPVTPNAYQTIPGGGYDGQITTIDPDGKLICASYFGGSFQTDNVYGIGIAQNDDIFLTGNTGSTVAQGFKITPGAFQSVKSAGIDSYLARISDRPPPPDADFQGYASEDCAPVIFNVINKSIFQNTCASNTTFTWSFPGGIPASSNLKDPPPVTYSNGGNYKITLIVRNSGGVDSSSLDVTVLGGIPISINTPQPICKGDTVSLTAGGASGYTWSPSAGLNTTSGSSVKASPDKTTIYTVSGTSTSGCSGSATVKVSIIDKPVVTVSPEVSICPGGSTTLNATGGSVYTWSPALGLNVTNSPSVLASPQTTTIYSVSVSDGKCPPVKDSVRVNIVQSTVATVTADKTICRGDTILLTASGGDQYTWTPLAGLSNNSGPTVKASPSLTTTYTVSVKNGTCNPVQANVKVTVVNPPTPSLSSDTTICKGGKAILRASGGTTFLWSPAPTLNKDSGSVVEALPDSTTRYSVKISNGFCPAITKDILITVLQKPNLDAGLDASLCRGDSILLTATGGEKYIWSPSAGLDKTNSSTVKAGPSQTTVYYVNASIGNCPPVKDSVKVNVVAPVNPVVSPDVSLCAGERVLLSASGGKSYQWSPNQDLSNTVGSSVTASPTKTITYYVKISSPPCPAISDSIKITVVEKVKAYAGKDTSVCAGNPIQLAGSGGISFSWSPTEGLSCTTCPSPIANPTKTTTYILSLTGGQCPSIPDSVVVNIVPLPNASAGISQKIIRGNTVKLKASGGTSYVWDNGMAGAEISFSPLDSEKYCVTVSEPPGCIDTACVFVYILEPSSLYIPSCFTPNDDETNDVFMVSDTNIVDFHGYIFNRWGELIYEWRNHNESWDGTYKGKRVQDDVYAYKIYATGTDGVIYSRTGVISVIR